MTTKLKNYEVIDRNGNRVHPKDSILRDGERLRVRANLMDTTGYQLRDAAAQLEDHQLTAFADALNGGQTLEQAIATARAVKRVEAFDARGHRPGFLQTHDMAASDAAHEQRDAILRDAWKSPPTVVNQGQQPAPSSAFQSNATPEELIAARDKQVSEAWRY